MSAIISTVQKSGLGYSATEVAKSIFYFLPIDSNIEDSIDYPLEVPMAGTIYSYEVWLRFRCDVAPDSYCKNFKIWTLGSLSSGVDITVNSDDVTTYLAPVNSLSVQGTRKNLLDYTESNKLSITGELNNIGDTTDWMVLQMSMDSTAEGQAKNLMIFYEYTEI